MMMWFFLITDTLTFSAFLAAYGFSRFKYEDIWPVPEDVFTHFPFLHGEHPLLFVALMTFILIMSSVTMVLAVNYGHKKRKEQGNNVAFFNNYWGVHVFSFPSMGVGTLHSR